MNDIGKSRDSMKKAVVDHYESALTRHGPTARGMDWKDESSQQLRFSILTEFADLNGRSVHDVGAGAGHLVDFLKERRIAARVSGSDLSAEMVSVARERHPEVPFHHWDILSQPDLPSFDVVLCSGLFHVKLDCDERAWESFVGDMIRKMYEMSRVGIAFNRVTDQVDFRSRNLSYSNPDRTLEFCRRELSREVELRQDYPLHEYSVYVYRTPPARRVGS